MIKNYEEDKRKQIKHGTHKKTFRRSFGQSEFSFICSGDVNQSACFSGSYLCAGQESHCQMYFVDPRVVSEDGKEEIYVQLDEKSHKPSVEMHANENGVRQRRPNASGVEDIANGHATGAADTKPISSDQNFNIKRILKFDIKAADSIQTDFLTPDPLQRVVRISPNGHFMCTGGTDGHLRVWSFPKMMSTADME